MDHRVEELNYDTQVPAGIVLDDPFNLAIVAITSPLVVIVFACTCP